MVCKIENANVKEMFAFFFYSRTKVAAYLKKNREQIEVCCVKYYVPLTLRFLDNLTRPLT